MKEMESEEVFSIIGDGDIDVRIERLRKEGNAAVSAGEAGSSRARCIHIESADAAGAEHADSTDKVDKKTAVRRFFYVRSIRCIHQYCGRRHLRRDATSAQPAAKKPAMGNPPTRSDRRAQSLSSFFGLLTTVNSKCTACSI